jgi:hypothetical protein
VGRRSGQSAYPHQARASRRYRYFGCHPRDAVRSRGQCGPRSQQYASPTWQMRERNVAMLNSRRLADMGNMFRDLDGWLRRRLRQVRWKEWKTTAAKWHNLRIRGISERTARKWAGSSKGYWRVAGSKVLQLSLPGQPLPRIRRL